MPLVWVFYWSEFTIQTQTGYIFLHFVSAVWDCWQILGKVPSCVDLQVRGVLVPPFQPPFFHSIRYVLPPDPRLSIHHLPSANGTLTANGELAISLFICLFVWLFVYLFICLDDFCAYQREKTNFSGNYTLFLCLFVCIAFPYFCWGPAAAAVALFGQERQWDMKENNCLFVLDRMTVFFFVHPSAPCFPQPRCTKHTQTDHRK